MNTLYKILIVFFIVSYSATANAQNSEDVKSLIKQGVAFHDQGNYAEAIEKYKEALKIEPENYQACYEISFTLYSSGKGNDALPYLNKVINSNSPLRANCFDLLGSLADDNHQPEKAIEYFKEGIKANPQYERLYFNLSITYLRQKNYVDAETAAIEAIKLDPKHASSQRAYALANYYQNKRACSLLAWCSFLILEPQTKRSEEAYSYIQKIINYGITRSDNKNVKIIVSGNSPENSMMPIIIIGSTVDKKGLSGIDSLQLQLSAIFASSRTIIGENASKFALNFFSYFFDELQKSGNMPAFVRLVNLSVSQPENMKWFTENNAQLVKLNEWIATTKREF